MGQLAFKSVPELLMVKQLLRKKNFFKYIAVPKEENGPSLISVLFFL